MKLTRSFNGWPLRTASLVLFLLLSKLFIQMNKSCVSHSCLWLVHHLLPISTCSPTLHQKIHTWRKPSPPSSVAPSPLYIHPFQLFQQWNIPQSLNNFHNLHHLSPGVFLHDPKEEEEEGGGTSLYVSGVLWHGFGFWRSSYRSPQIQPLSSHRHHCGHLHFITGTISR